MLGYLSADTICSEKGTVSREHSFENCGLWGTYRGQVSGSIIHQIFLPLHDWFKRVTWLNITQLKLVNIRGYSPIVKTACAGKSIWSIIKPPFWAKICLAIIIVLGHNLFLEAHSFPRATLSKKNCSLVRTDNVRRHISRVCQIILA